MGNVPVALQDSSKNDRCNDLGLECYGNRTVHVNLRASAESGSHTVYNPVLSFDSVRGMRSFRVLNRYVILKTKGLIVPMHILVGPV